VNYQDKYKVGDVVLFDRDVASSKRGMKWARNKTPLIILETSHDNCTVKPINDVDGSMSADWDRILGFADKLSLVKSESKEY
jgi:hypothetical protein